MSIENSRPIGSLTYLSVDGSIVNIGIDYSTIVMESITGTLDS